MNTRYLAAQTVQKVIFNSQSLSEVLPQALAKVNEVTARSAIQDLTYNALRWYFQLNTVLNFLLNSPLKNKDGDITCILLIGLYEIFHTDKPEYAIVNETVAYATAAKKSWAKGLINAALRRSIREKQKILIEIAKEEQSEYAHPDWIINFLHQQWPSKWQTILKENNKLPPMWLRVNQQKTTTENYKKLLQEKDYNSFLDKELPMALLLEKPVGVQQLPHFEKGFCSVQDAAGQYATQLLDLQNGMRVLDACAAPGSKTCHILETGLSLEVIAIEKSATRTELLKENLQRLEVSAQLIIDDAMNIQDWWDEKLFDRILLDVPCSATGVIRRHPDIKLLRKESDMAELVQTQQKLLKTLWQTLKPGGKLLYSTCSMFSQENSEIIKWFLENEADAKLIPITIAEGVDTGFGIQLFPGDLSRDGFFYALLGK